VGSGSSVATTGSENNFKHRLQPVDCLGKLPKPAGNSPAGYKSATRTTKGRDMEKIYYVPKSWQEIPKGMEKTRVRAYACGLCMKRYKPEGGVIARIQFVRMVDERTVGDVVAAHAGSWLDGYEAAQLPVPVIKPTVDKAIYNLFNAAGDDEDDADNNAEFRQVLASVDVRTADGGRLVFLRQLHGATSHKRAHACGLSLIRYVIQTAEDVEASRKLGQGQFLASSQVYYRIVAREGSPVNYALLYGRVAGQPARVLADRVPSSEVAETCIKLQSEALAGRPAGLPEAERLPLPFFPGVKFAK
jgi:hypothetical protein